MSTQLPGKYPCLDPSCGSSDARRKYTEGTSFCFSCKKWFPAEADDMEAEVKPKSPKVNSYSKLPDISEVTSFAHRGFKERGITKAICEFFDVRVSYDSSGNIDAHYYPYIKNGVTSYKVRQLPKNFLWLGESGDVFGIDKFASGGKRVIITEGEIDALSVAQAHLDKYNKIYPVISVPSATMVKKLVEHREWLRSFKEVVLCFDNDEAGNEAKEQALKIVGIDKAKIVKYPNDCKDANDVLVKHGGNAIMHAIWEAQEWSPAGIVKKEELWDQLVTYNSVPSVPYPTCMEGVNTKLKGMRPGEIALFISGTGCLAKSTEVLMYDGSLKLVEDVQIGDQVMGMDSTPRNVLNLFRGREEMAKITLRDGESFTCNRSHVLSVVNNDGEGRWGLTKNQIVDVSVNGYLYWSAKRKHLSKAFKTKRLEFSKKQLPMHPYVLGVWLGDGTSAAASFTCHHKDYEIIQKLIDLGVNISESQVNMRWNSPGGFRQELKALGVFENKHLPEAYLTSNIEDRLNLLAGLLDTDGHYDNGKNMYEFSQKRLDIISDVKRLAESLGFSTSLGKQKNNKFGNCYRLWISGVGLEDIPVALGRKRARPRAQIKDPNRYSFSVELLPEDDFYGFEVDGDNRYILGNFIVTHNSGKSTLFREIMLHILENTTDKIGVVSLEEAPAETARKLSGMAIDRNPAHEEIPLDDLKVGFDKVFGSDRVVVLDHQGSIKDDSIVDQLEYMALIGCKYLFIDHITILVSEGADGLTGNEAIDKVMNDLLRLVKRHPVWIGLVSHLRKAQGGGKSFEEGKLPSIDDIRGSGSIKQISFDIISFARNLTAESDIERNTIKMRILKSRYTGLTGTVPGAYYEHQTGRLKGLDNMPSDDFEIL